MTHSALASVLGSDFDGFLYAPLGEDRNDVPLSVLSALARQNVDAWQQAAQLAELPAKIAIQKLALLIPECPDELSATPNIETIAARLIALLPRHAGLKISSAATLADAHKINEWVAVVFYAVFMFLAINKHEPTVAQQPPSSVQVDNVHAGNSPPTLTSVASLPAKHE